MLLRHLKQTKYDIPDADTVTKENILASKSHRETSYRNTICDTCTRNGINNSLLKPPSKAIRTAVSHFFTFYNNSHIYPVFSLLSVIQDFYISPIKGPRCANPNPHKIKITPEARNEQEPKGNNTYLETHTSYSRKKRNPSKRFSALHLRKNTNKLLDPRVT